MEENIKIAEGEIDLAIEVHIEMHEFSGFYKREEIEDVYKNRNSLILTAYWEGEPVGFMLCYDKYKDGSFYCWMTGVKPAFRRRGILTKMMEYVYGWALRNEYEKITLKTRNNRREMLAYLIKNGFNIKNMEINPAIEENKILFERSLI